MLKGHTSYARPYKSQILVSQESLVSSVYRSRSHSLPRPARKTTTEEKASKRDITVENKLESEDSVLIKVYNELKSEDCIEKNQIPLQDNRKSDEMLATDSNRRFQESIKIREDVGDCPHIKKCLSRSTVNFFEKTKQSFGNLTYQHLTYQHKRPIRTPNFSFLQTLV